ncbi:hypothetical protein [Nocardioides sp.]|uniref:hypothetical protein n=1 Tax=Nocardioides sp. TaxID=35761 RepID=UPI002626A7DC|nr:hypothetical protein [Nocardioides sp.]
MNPRPAASAVRRLVTVIAGLAALTATSLVLAGPASADVPEAWPPAPEVDRLHAILLLGGIPVLLFVLIIVVTYLPALMRGESVTPGGSSVEDQWLGGRRSDAELAAPDSETSAAGGASGGW